MPKAKGQADGAWQARRRAVTKKARAEKVHAMLVTRPEDVSYLSGFSGDDSWLLVGGGFAVLLTDGRYDEQARAECPGLDVHVRKGGLSDALKECLAGRGVRRLGFQKGHLTVGIQEGIGKAIGEKKLCPLDDLVDQLRTVKDEQEIRIIQKAVRVAEEAFLQLIAGGAKALIGRSEQSIAAELDYRMRMLGASASSFETIVGVAENGSKPHYRPAGRTVKPGESVLIDWGALVDGYCSDLTRVVFTGTIPPALGEVYQVVHRAQQAGVRALGPGVACKSVDAAARGVIEAAGYGRQFVHGLGHGVGRQIHEAPGLARTSKARLRPGMVVTVEPGIYLPGVGGVRIEDDVLVTAEGRRRLSRLPNDLSAMVLR